VHRSFFTIDRDNVNVRHADYGVLTPEGIYTQYDGLVNGTLNLVVEAKRGYGWFFNPDSQGLRETTLSRWDNDKAEGLEVADRCRLVHIWVFNDRSVADLVRQ
jgi:hypothetical protein